MPRIVRTYDTDLDDLAYQVSRSYPFTAIRTEFTAGEIPDDEAQERIAELIDGGACRLDGDRGTELLEWSLSESETARLISQLYRQYLGAD
jgi:hypothetical protein